MLSVSIVKKDLGHHRRSLASFYPIWQDLRQISFGWKPKFISNVMSSQIRSLNKVQNDHQSFFLPVPVTYVKTVLETNTMSAWTECWSEERIGRILLNIFQNSRPTSLFHSMYFIYLLNGLDPFPDYLKGFNCTITWVMCMRLVR